MLLMLMLMSMSMSMLKNLCVFLTSEGRESSRVGGFCLVGVSNFQQKLTFVSVC